MHDTKAWYTGDHRLADKQLVQEAIEWAVLNYLGDPCRLDPSKGKSLFGYVLAVALNALRHAYRTECRQRGAATETFSDEQVLGSVLDPLAIALFPSDLLVAKEERDQRQQLLGERKRLPDEFLGQQPHPDQDTLRLILSGDRHHVSYAKVLDIADLPESEQRRAVIQLKNRLYQRLKYFIRSGGGKGVRRESG